MGLLMSALGGAAEVGMNQMQDQRRADLQSERDLAQEESGKRLAQYNSDLALKRAEALEKIRAQSVIDKENYDLSPERVEKVAKSKLNAHNLEAPLRQKQTEEAIDIFRQKSAATLEAEINKLTDPKFISGTKNFKNATRDTSGDALRAVQLKAANIALEEKQAEIKMPYADRQIAESLKDQLKAKSAIIDKVTAEGSGTPEGIAQLQAERSALSKELTKVYEPFRSKSGLIASEAGEEPQKANKWNSETGEVMSNGTVIGTAKSAAEARTLLSSNRQKPEPTKTDKPKAPGPFTGAHGETQLLQPIFDASKNIGDWRRKLQEQSAGQ